MIDEYFMVPFYLVDLSQMSDDELKDRLWSGVLSMAMKRVHSKKLSEVMDLLVMVEKVFFSPEKSFSILVLQYILEGSKLSSDRELITALNERFDEKFRSKVMTLGQRIEIRGETRGKQQVVSNMLKERFQPDVINRVTGLGIAEIQRIADTLKLEAE